MYTARSFTRMASWGLALIALPLLLLVAGCDSNGGGTEPPEPPEPPEPEVESANYDTTMVDGVATIVIDEFLDGADEEGEGIVLIDEEGNTIDEGDGDENTVTWTSDYEYRLNGRVFVNEGQTLNIDAGTVIRGTGGGDPLETGALVVARGGTINAVGTADDPIIFTAIGDESPSGNFNTNYSNGGNWGGVLLLGNAPNNTEAGSLTLEGLADEPRAQYGGDDPEDSSGRLEYVSIRYGGSQISDGNEINGLTLGSVGSGTTIDYVEVVSNLDDGFEWFGGTVNATHLVAAFVGDDSFDIDQGYNGSLQYLLAVQGFGGGERGGEHDSGDSDLGANGEASEPVARPQICNATYIGRSEGDVALHLREKFGGAYYKSIFTGFPNGLALIEDKEGADSRQEFEDGNLRIEGNIGVGFGETLTANEGDFGTAVTEYLQNNNVLLSELGGFAVTFDGSGAVTALDPFPAAGSEAFGEVSAGTCLEDTDYVGAFGDGDNWAEGWTAISQSGLLSN